MSAKNKAEHQETVLKYGVQELFITFIASVLIWLLFFGLFILWFIDGRIKKEQVLHALFAVTFAWLLTLVIKEFFPTDRPFIVNPEYLPKTLTIPTDSSFPSTHTATAFALATSIFLHERKTGALFIAGAVLVALGRVLANVHYPMDILAGALFGMLIAWTVGKTHFYRILERRN